MQTLTANVTPVVEQISQLQENYGHSVALSYGDQQLSYKQLNYRADRFAGHLVQLGVVPGDTVAICMERSFDWIVAALGIMRAGAAYVPLDSAWPDSRLRFAVEDSDATVLVAREALLDHLQVKAHGVDPCRDAAAIAATPGVARRTVQAESLAYVIYTSGSTGVPKGVEITHANLEHLVRWYRNAFKVTRRDRASHLAGLGFDATVWEIWPHLSAGSTVCLANESVRSSPDLIRQWMVRERVTIGFVPTVHATAMMAMEWPTTTALRFLLTGGAVLHHAPPVKLPFDVVNNYGPTECTVVATSSVIKAGLHRAPPIGRPIAGAKVYLLNENGEQVPDGVAGEIYIGGSGVGRGYRNLREATERSFLPDPFAGVLCARMYRTGDLGVRRADGEIEFHGRLDRQTKIRGQRVELDEIGSILMRHPSIEFATVITHIEEGGESKLLAYVLPKENIRVPTADELQKYLLSSLPVYMIPEIFVRLHELPLSLNGKLELKMLAPPTEATLLERAHAKPRATRIEEKMLTMVQELLENYAVRVEDNFFLAGGNSLLGMRLLMRLRDAFGADLTLRQVFEAPTIQQLALLVDPTLTERPLVQQHVDLTHRHVEDKPVLPSGVLSLQPQGTRKSIFWVHYQSIELSTVMGEEQPFFSVALTAEDVASLGKMPPAQSIAACLRCKILATQSTGPYIIGGFCLGGILAYEIASQLRAAGHEVSLLVLVDAPNPAYLESCDSLTHQVSYLGYALKRAARLGLRTSLVHLAERLRKRFTHAARTQSTREDTRMAQEMCEAAILTYRPEKYEGDVLLLLACERPPHVNFLPGWRVVVPDNLHIRYLDGHHSDLLKVTNVRSVGDAIVSHLVTVTGGKSLSCCAVPTESIRSGVKREIRAGNAPEDTEVISARRISMRGEAAEMRLKE